MEIKNLYQITVAALVTCASVLVVSLITIAFIHFGFPSEKRGDQGEYYIEFQGKDKLLYFQVSENAWRCSLLSHATAQRASRLIGWLIVLFLVLRKILTLQPARYVKGGLRKEKRELKGFGVCVIAWGICIAVAVVSLFVMFIFPSTRTITISQDIMFVSVALAFLLFWGGFFYFTSRNIRCPICRSKLWPRRYRKSKKVKYQAVSECDKCQIAWSTY